jgi:PAS domain S-box-containing protein
MQSRLRESGSVMATDESLHTFAENLPQLAWMADRTGSVYWHNRRWHEYTGASARASRGWSWLQFVQPDHAERVETGLRSAIAAGIDWEDTFLLRGADGAPQWFLSRAVPLRDDRGAIVQWCGTSTNVTGRVRVEDDLRAAARRKDALLAWLGHELRNPLTPILTSAHLLTMLGPSDPAARTARETIVRQALHLSNLVDDLLDAGRLSFGKLRLRRTPLELTPLIAQAIEACHGEIERRQHRLEVNLAPVRVIIDADPTRIVQLVSNLLNNAAKYMRNGGTIRVVTELEGELVVVRVRDEGIGIAPDVLWRVFDPYVQVGVGPLHTQGLGIGLALVKSIAEGHGGTAEARSEGPERGSEFIVHLPVTNSEAVGGQTCSIT